MTGSKRAGRGLSWEWKKPSCEMLDRIGYVPTGPPRDGSLNVSDGTSDRLVAVRPCSEAVPSCTPPRRERPARCLALVIVQVINTVHEGVMCTIGQTRKTGAKLALRESVAWCDAHLFSLASCEIKLASARFC